MTGTISGDQGAGGGSGERARAAVDATSERVKVLYILGTQRGGTTIAGRLLGQLGGFEFVGELRRIYEVGVVEDRRCGCGRRYDECDVWSAVLPGVLAGVEPTEIQRWQRLAIPRYRSSLGALYQRNRSQDDAVRRYGRVMSDTYRALTAATGARVIVDSSKSPAEASLLADLDSLDVFVLHIVRDPRGTVHSSIRRAKGESSRADHLRQAVSGSAWWLLRHLTAAALRRRQGAGRSMLVSYEAMTADPNGVMRAVAGLVGEPPPGRETVVDGVAPLRVAHTPTGAGRFAAGSVELVRDDRWRSELSSPERLIVTALTRPLARRYGYRARIGKV